MKSNMTDAFGNVMAVVGAKGDVAGAKQLQKSILKGGGVKKFQIDKGEAFKQGAKNTGASIQNFVQGGIRSGTKKLFKQGVTRLKNGFKNTLTAEGSSAANKIREGVKNAPDNLKNKFDDKLKSLKESFTGPKKLDTIDTPHGKLTKAPEGGSTCVQSNPIPPPKNTSLTNKITYLHPSSHHTINQTPPWHTEFYPTALI